MAAAYGIPLNGVRTEPPGISSDQVEWHYQEAGG